jgi:hypothetical protein
MPQTEPFCCIRDCHSLALRRACHLQQKLVLLRLQSRTDRCAFAEVKKLTQLITKLSQSPK